MTALITCPANSQLIEDDCIACHWSSQHIHDLN